LKNSGEKMPYICKDCYNKTRFKQNQYGRCTYYCTHFIDQDGENVDTEDYEYDDHEETDNDRLACRECGGEDVEEVSDDEWEAWAGPDEEEEEPKNWKELLEKRQKE